MNPEDRLIINYTPEKALKIDGHLVIGSVWSGRLPRVTEEKEVEDKIKRK